MLLEVGLVRIPNDSCYTFTMPRRTVDSQALTKGTRPREPIVTPGQPLAPVPASLAALATAGQPDQEGTRYDLEAAHEQVIAQAEAGSRSNRAEPPHMLNIILPPHSALPSAPSPPELQNKIALNPRLTGLEEADQKVMFQYYKGQHENRSDYEVARVFKVPVELVARFRKTYEWDREVTTLEDNASLDEMDQNNLHDLIALEMQTITGLQGFLGRHNAASASLEQMKKLPRPAHDPEKMAWDDERNRLLHETMSPTMLMNIVDSLMTLKKAKIGQRKRKPGKMYVIINDEMAAKLQKEFNNRPIAPEPDGEGA
jgi:hypothetical protein